MEIDRQLIAATISPLTLEPQELDALVAALRNPPRPAIRLRPEVNPWDLSFETSPVPWHRQGRFLSHEVRPASYPAYASGEYYIQDAASLLALALLNPQPDEILCDLCAAPGGKSTAILEAIGDRGWLLANEAVQSRRAVLEFNLARHGSTHYLVAGLDPDELARRLPGQFDAVLVDAPCSGQSLVSRGKQTTASFALKTVEHCAARQTRILDAAAVLVRPQGRLVYSTCTFAFAENEAQIGDFLQRHSEWQLVPVDPKLATIIGISPDQIGARLWPHQHGCGGAFAACLQRQSSELGFTEDRDRSRPPTIHPASWISEFQQWGELSEVQLWHNKLQYFAWPQETPDAFIRLALSGPEAAFRKGNTWFPAYALAMRRDPRWHPKQTIELAEDATRKYLRGEVIPGSLNGWAVAQRQGKALGWVKGDGKQLKNHLPKAARIGSS